MGVIENQASKSTIYIFLGTTMGGQTALNLAMAAEKKGILDNYYQFIYLKFNFYH